MNNPGSTSFQTVRNVNKTDFKTVKHYKLSKYRLHYFDCNHFMAIKTAILFGYVTHVQSNTLVYSLTSTKEQALVKNVYTRVCVGLALLTTLVYLAYFFSLQLHNIP